MLDDLDEVVFRTDPAGTWTTLSSGWTRLTGFEVGASLGTSFLDYVHPDEQERTLALFRAVVEGGADHCLHEGRYRRADGGYRQVRLRAKVLRDEHGVIVGNVGTLVDITSERLGGRSVDEHAHLLELVAGGAAFEDLPIGVVEYTAEHRVARVTPALYELLGPSVAPGAALDLLGGVLRAVGGGPELAGPSGLAATATATGSAQHADLCAVGSGREAVFRTTVLLVRRPGGSGLTLVLQDVTDRRRAERAQQAVSDLGRLALSGADLPDLFDQAVTRVREVLGAASCEILERPDGDDVLLTRATDGWPAGGAPRVLSSRELAGSVIPLAAQATLRSELPGLPWPGGCSPSYDGPVSSAAVTVGSAADPFGFLCAHAPAPHEFSGDDLTFLSSVANVLYAAVDRRRTEERILHRSLHDPLTGLANRLLLQERFDQALVARRRVGGRVALLLVDLDRFKEINDTLGHDTGDQVLQVVADRLRHQFRESDTVARLGGDEFAVLLTPVTDEHDCQRLAATLRDQIARPMTVQGLTLHLQGSVGMTLAPDHGDDPVALLKRADVAMYRAKQAPSGLELYTAETDLNRPERLAYGTALRRALTRDELVLHYQPKQDLRTGATTGVEALVRWQHPTQGLLGPDAFIPLAEQTGLIQPLTVHVLGSALAQAAAWSAAGDMLPVAVNVSARSLHDMSLVGTVLEHLDRLRLPPTVLELELTESAVMANPRVAMAVTAELRAAGVRIALDDFGTGYSSLAYLRDLALDSLKIDRSFLHDVTSNDRNASIVRAVVDLGHTLGLQVVAEGVETAAARDLLQDLGCDQGQGYLLGRPGPPGDLQRVSSSDPASRPPSAAPSAG